MARCRVAWGSLLVERVGIVYDRGMKCLFRQFLPVALLSLIPLSVAASGVIEGQVLDASSQPVTNVTVYVRPTGASSPFYLNTTDAAGAYRVQGIPAGEYYLFTQTPGGSDYLNEWYDNVPGQPFASPPAGVTPVAVVNLATNAGIDFSLERGGGILGFVTNDAGAKLTGVRVDAYDTNGSVAASTTSDTLGFYNLTKLREGAYRLRAESLGSVYLAEWYEGISTGPGGIPPPEATSIVVTQGNTRTGIDFGLSVGGEVRGSVSNQVGQPLPGINVQAYDSLGTLVGSGFTGGNGTYAIQGLFSGTVYIASSAGAQNYVNAWYGGAPRTSINTGGVPVEVQTGTATAGIHLVLAEGAVIRCVATNGQITTFPSIQVQVFRRPDELILSAQRLVNLPVTLNGLPPGELFVRVEGDAIQDTWYQGLPASVATDRVPGGAIAVVGNAGQTSSVDIAVAPAASVAGTVLNLASQPVHGVEVVAVDRLGQMAAVTTSVANGTFRLSGLNDGVYGIQAGGADTSGASYLHTWFGGASASHGPRPGGDRIALHGGEAVSNLQFFLASGGAMTGRVTVGGGNAVAGCEVIAVSRTSRTKVATAGTDAAGRYRIAGLAPGDYAVRTRVRADSNLADEWFPGLAVTSAVPEGAGTVTLTGAVSTVHVDLMLEAGVAMSGRVLGNGQPIPGVVLDLYNLNGDRVRSNVAVDLDGRYSLEGVGSGTYALRTRQSAGFIDEWYPDAPVTSAVPGASAALLTVQQSFPVTNLNLDLVSGSSITVRVAEASSGAPVAGVLVQAVNRIGDVLAEAAADGTGVAVVQGLPAMEIFLSTAGVPATFGNAWYDGIPATAAGVPPAATGLTVPVGISGVVTMTVHVLDLALDGVGEGQEVQWSGEVGRTYQVQAAPSLTGSWATAPFGKEFQTRPLVTATGDSILSYHPPEGGTNRTSFYRIRLAD